MQSNILRHTFNNMARYNFIDTNRTKIDWLDWLLQKFLEMETLWHPLVSFKINYCCRQSPIIKNGPIRNDAEILGNFKERTLSKSKLRNAKFASK